MKKLLFMLMGVVAAINAMAVDYTAKAVLTLEATSGYTCEMTLKQADEYGALNGAEMYMSGRKVALYALKETTPLQIAKAANLTNLKLGLKADVSTDYTITVTGVAGTETLVLWDLVAGEQHNLTEGKVINFTTAANTTIEDRFIINYLPVSIKGTGDWWGLGKDVDLAISADLQTATGSLTFDAAGWYNFKVVRGTEWLSNAGGFDRTNNSQEVNATESDNMYFEIDAIGASNEYAFTWTFATNTLTIGFPAAPAPAYAAEVTTNEYGLATFSHASDLAPVEAGVKLYKGAVSGETLALTQVADIAAEQGVIVYGEANTTYHFNVINGATADFAGNQLLAKSAWSASHDGYDIYVLSGNALYLYEGTEFPDHKAFLKIAQSANPSPRRIRLVFDQATAIDNISADNVKAEKVVENGQILIRRGNEVYNLQGQIVK